MNRRAWNSSLLRSVAVLGGVVLAWAAALGAGLWSLLDDATRAAVVAGLREQGGAVALVFVLLLLAALALALRAWLRNWSQAAARMADEVAIVAAGQGLGRVQALGSPELAALGQAINTLAERHAQLNADVQAQAAEAGGRLVQQAQWRAELLGALTGALLAELPQAVLLCSADGRVLLYNPAAARLLADESAPLGLGRPVTDWIDADALAHALAGWAGDAPAPLQQATQVVVHRRHGSQVQLLRCRFVALRLAPADAGAAATPLDGYLTILQDLSRQVQDAGRRDRALLELGSGSGSALAGLTAAAQMLAERPQMALPMRERFVREVQEEAQRLSRQLEQARGRVADPLADAWPCEHMRAADLVAALQRNLAALPVALDVALGADTGGPPAWLRLECHALVQAMSHLAGAARASLGIESMRLRWSQAAGCVQFDLLWSGLPLQQDQLAQWEGQPFASAEQGVAVTLREVLERHGAQVRGLGEAAAGSPGWAGLALTLPIAGAHPTPPADATAAPSRPVVYDFALLQQRSIATALHERPLDELIYTVFDTETTGLNPSEGDEIISIGAYRIVGGRLLEHECFERLIEPRRPVRESARAVHGISQAMLAGQPPAEAVLPAFARFCAGSVLVAHNAAFDLRFLELARGRTGAGFDQPVLDTLLLSSILHPGHTGPEHRLEAIAARLGVAVEGRHTAMGDAEATGRVFLAMLPLLAARGIATLGQALAASQQSAYAQLKY